MDHSSGQNGKIIGVVVGWIREGMGGILLIIASIGNFIFAYSVAGHNKGFAMAISGGPWFIVGCLYLASWWRRRPQRTLGHA